MVFFNRKECPFWPVSRPTTGRISGSQPHNVRFRPLADDHLGLLSSEKNVKAPAAKTDSKADARNITAVSIALFLGGGL
jgi:hypothetical protein